VLLTEIEEGVVTGDEQAPATPASAHSSRVRGRQRGVENRA
jgi:hypothetical protein